MGEGRERQRGLGEETSKKTEITRLAFTVFLLPRFAILQKPMSLLLFRF
jgi:hypothetical protein